MPAKAASKKASKVLPEASVNTLRPEMMNNLMHNLPGMAYRCNNDADWTMLFVSEGCLGLTGYHPLELLYNGNKSYEELIHPDDRDLVRNAVDAGVQGHKPFRMQYRIINKGGSTVHVWEQGSAVYDKVGNVLFLDGFITDITHRVRVERALKEEAERWGERSQLKDAIFSIVAHDLQNPVYAIISNSEYLADNSSQISEQQRLEFIRQITTSARDMLRLLDNLVDLTKLRSGMIAVQPERFRLGPFIQECVGALKGHAQAKNISISLGIPRSIMLYTDKKMLATIMRNVLSNAIKYSHRDSGVEVLVSEETGAIRLSVVDHGVGMTRSDARNAHDLLKRTRRIGTDKESGSGLGLVLSADLARLLNITIDIQSKPNHGTTLTLMFPPKDK